MKKYLYILFISLSIIAQSCTQDDGYQAENHSGFYLSIKMEADAEEDGEKLAVESLRLLVFDAVTNNCIYNDVPSSEQTYIPTIEGVGYWELTATATLSDISLSDKLDVYAVLNENAAGWSELAGGKGRLGTALAEVRELREFVELLETPLLFDESASEAGVGEPAFVMCGYKKNISIRECSIENGSYVIWLDDSNQENQAVERTMAMITITTVTGTGEKTISNELGDVGAIHAVSSIFVLDLSLVNVPDSYVWNNSQENDVNSTISISVTGSKSGSYEDDMTTYFDRKWEGTIEQEVTAKYTQGKAPVDESGQEVRLYNFGAGGGNDSWFTLLDITRRNGTGGNFNGGGKIGAVGMEQLEDGIWGPVIWGLSFQERINQDGKIPSNEGNLTAVINDYFDLTKDGEFEWGDPEVVRKEEWTTVDGGDWAVSIDKSWYIPEKIASEKDQAIALKITLALAEPKIGEFNWEHPDIEWDDSKYVVQGDTLVIGAANATFFHDYSKACYAHQPEIVEGEEGFVENYNNTGRYWYFIGGIESLREGDTGDHFIQEITGMDQTSWKVDVSTATSTIDFIVPIAAINGDYSIHRNTKYAISIQVNDNTYDAIVAAQNGNTRSLNSNTPPITLQVETTELVSNPKRRYP